MFTPQSLLEYAISLESLLPEADGAARRYELRSEMTKAMLCATHMENEGIKKARCIGPFLINPPKRGQKVRIKKGAKIHSTSDRLRRICGRDYTVKVHSVMPGHVYEEDRLIILRETEVTWTGAGGYWCWTTLDNVETVEE